MNKNKILVALSAVLIANNTQALAHADTHAPIGVMGDHTHKAGEWMLSYRFMEMGMEDLYDGDSKVDSMSSNGTFMMMPTKMQMKMHMFGGMYGLDDKNTLMVMVPYLENKMDMINTMNSTASQMKSEGLGDIKVINMRKLGKGQVNYGISLPVGDINEEDGGVRLPYRMQLGSGTYDPIIAYTRVTNFESSSVGYQAKATFRLGRNSADYSLGEKYEFTQWYAKRFGHYLSTSLRMNFQHETNIDGDDDQITAGMSSSTRNPNLTGGTKLHGGVGVNYIIPHTNDTRLSVEYSWPIYQNLEGPQLGTANILTIGLQKAF